MHSVQEESSAFRSIPTMRGQIGGVAKLKAGSRPASAALSRMIATTSLRISFIKRVLSPS